ncbi:MAG: hypothetical protein IKB51_05645 [Clostridia bacterium]|nr:hypothetical protein [Clostridia bacterium]
MLKDYTDIKMKMLSYAVSLLPERFRSACNNYLLAYPDICEIRLRIDSPLSFTLSASNLITGMMISREDIRFTLDKMTDGNYFKNEELMRGGYISLLYGIRVGVCGDVFVSGGAVKTLKYVNYINIRLPSAFISDCSPLISYIESSLFSASVLVISPPCCGKTTLLRSAALTLASAPYNKRVCVVDTNRELLLPSSFGVGLCEYMVGYPKAYGINVAMRYMNPQYIICDEIGGSDEAEAICELQHSGVPFLASAHADTFASLKMRKNIDIMLQNGVFEAVLRIKRTGKSFEYEIKRVSEL